MKKTIFTLSFVLISIINTFGLDYQTISSNRIAYFDNEYYNIKCIRIDSVKHQGDSVLFPFYAIQQLNYECFSPFVASWIGKSVTIKDNGLNEFINKKGDTISIKTNTNLNDKWIAFVSQDSLIIEASVIIHDTMTFLGITDSVKTIEFKAYDKSMNHLDLEINDMHIQISKGYGFVKAFNFYLFPNLQVDYLPEKFEEYNLIGLSNPKVGVNNLTWFDVHDYQVGDELHVLDESSCWFGVGYGLATTNKAIYKYLERVDYSDSIVYRYSRKQSIYTSWADSSDFKYFEDTLTTTIKPDLLFDKLPGEPIVNEYETYNYYMRNESPLSKTNPGAYESFAYRGDSCWGMLIVDGCFSSFKYIKGLGGPYYACTQAFCFGGEERKLVYFKKGDVSWGNPLIISGISNISTEKNIIIYPNPARNHINVTISNSNYHGLDIFIYDSLGKLQKTTRLPSYNSTISVSDLNSGIYILKISDNNKVLKIDRLIIE